MKTVEELKILANDLNNECGKNVLRFKVMNNKFGTGISWTGTWGCYGGYCTTSGVVQRHESDEDFVAQVKRCSQEAIEKLVEDYKDKNKDHRFLSPKFVSVMEQYIKNN